MLPKTLGELEQWLAIRNARMIPLQFVAHEGWYVTIVHDTTDATYTGHGATPDKAMENALNKFRLATGVKGAYRYNPTSNPCRSNPWDVDDPRWWGDATPQAMARGKRVRVIRTRLQGNVLVADVAITQSDDPHWGEEFTVPVDELDMPYGKTARPFAPGRKVKVKLGRFGRSPYGRYARRANPEVVITEESHLDHGISAEQMDFVLNALRDGTAKMVVGPFGSFFIATVTVPGSVPCALHGPIVGEPPVDETEVTYGRRGNRPNLSRLVDWAPTRSSEVTVIASDGKLITAFGGPLSPKEVSDPNLKPEERAESESFWAQHALSR